MWGGRVPRPRARPARVHHLAHTTEVCNAAFHSGLEEATRVVVAGATFVTHISVAVPDLPTNFKDSGLLSSAVRTAYSALIGAADTASIPLPELCWNILYVA
jgi:hypothetical protein